ncbi:hypothetical protein KUCAC02_033429 [Chaenocephalus aceratus]|nr:hypothetical protein KUCAC02_033429 [Chaenocephalus aceratus]
MAGPSTKAKSDIALTPKRKRTFIDTWKTQFPWAIAEVEKDRVSEDLKASRFFALMGNGSTDISVTEQENVYVRYVKDGLPATEFIDIMAVKSADANGVLAALLEA